MKQKTKYTVAISSAATGALLVSTTAFARAGDGQDYVPVGSGDSSGSYGGGGFSFGGGSIVSVVIFVAIAYGVMFFLKKKGVSTNVKNPLGGFGNINPTNMNNNPMFNNSVQRDLQRGNVQEPFLMRR